MQLLGRLALRKNELRLLRVRDFDLGQGTFLVHGKGGKVVVMPIAFADLKADLELHLVGRDPRRVPALPEEGYLEADEQSRHSPLAEALSREGGSASRKPDLA